METRQCDAFVYILTMTEVLCLNSILLSKQLLMHMTMHVFYIQYIFQNTVATVGPTATWAHIVVMSRATYLHASRLCYRQSTFTGSLKFMLLLWQSSCNVVNVLCYILYDDYLDLVHINMYDKYSYLHLSLQIGDIRDISSGPIVQSC